MSDNGAGLGVLGENVVVAAIEWWHGHCPLTWTLEQHLASPIVNVSTPREAALLAKAVAAFLHAKQRHDRGHRLEP